MLVTWLAIQPIERVVAGKQLQTPEEILIVYQIRRQSFKYGETRALGIAFTVRR